MKKLAKLHKITAFITAILIVITALSLIGCCIAIYASHGDSQFTKERIAEYSRYVIIQSVAAIEMIIFGIVLNFAFPPEKIKFRAKPSDTAANKRLTEKLKRRDEILLRTDARINREKAYRKNTSILLVAVISIFAISAIIFAMLTEHSENDIDVYVLKVTIFVVLLFSISGALMHIYGILLQKSYKREKDALKDLLVIANSDNPVSKKEEKADKKPIYINILRTAIVTIALAFILLGMLNGGMDSVLAKAVRICTECIGLG